MEPSSNLPAVRFNEEQTSEIESLLALKILDREQLERLAALAHVSSPLPPPDFHIRGKAKYRRETIQEWGKQAIHHRSSALVADRRQTGLHAAVRSRTWNEQSRSFEAIFASENPAAVIDFRRMEVVEEILLASGGEFPARFPVLDSHQKATTESVIGSASHVRREGSQWIGRVTLADDPLAISIGNKIRDGHLDSMSIGYRLLEYVEISPGKTATIAGRQFRNERRDRTLRVVTSWVTHEVSVVPWGADSQAKIRAGHRSMPAIHSRNSLTHRPHVGELVSAAMVRAGISDPSQCRARLGGLGLERVDQHDAVRDAEGGDRYASYSMNQLFRQACELDGISLADGLTQLYYASERLGFSTTSTGALFTDVFASLFVAGWDAAGDSTMGWVAESDRPDLLLRPNLRLVGGELKQRRRAEQAAQMDLAANSEDSQVGSYAMQVTLDEVDILNGGMADFMQNIPRMLGSAARALRPNLVYSYLARNPVMSDGTALFHADHGNLKTGAPLGATTLGEANSAIAQHEENGVKLNLRGQYLIVPTTRQRCGAATLREIELRDQESVQPPALKSDSRLDNGLVDPLTGEEHAGSESTWYLSTRGVYALEAQYLTGTNRMPRIRTWFLDRGQFGVVFDVSHFVGVVAVGYQGIVKNTE